MGKVRRFKKRRALRTVPQFGGGMEQIVGADWRSFSATADVAFLLGFSSLFSIINPIGGALIFDSIAKDFAPADRMMMAARVGFYSLLVMFGALWGGTYVLHFFGVSIDALRIAGGTVVASSGWQLLISGDRHADQKGHEPVALWGGDGDPQQLAFFPLTLPFTTGPGTIAVAITIGAERPSNDGLVAFFVGTSLAAVANAGIIWIAYRFSDRLTRFMGATARQVIVRLTAFLLMCIGVQILVGALGDLIAQWRVA
jgi:multiple antibiotic resistance protein